jgi:hypothetical protein
LTFSFAVSSLKGGLIGEVVMIIYDIYDIITDISNNGVGKQTELAFGPADGSLYFNQPNATLINIGNRLYKIYDEESIL